MAAEELKTMRENKTISSLVLDLPIRTYSEMNQRDNWRAVFRRKRAQKKEVNAEWVKATKGQKVRLPCVVTLTRTGCNLLDSDGLQASFKFIRDEIASLLSCDDAPDSPVQFRYEQQAIGKREYRVIIDVKSS